MLERIMAHARRLSYHFGRGIAVGSQRFKAQGYVSSCLDHSAFRHEPYLVHVLERLLSARPGAFVDVGVNVGQTLLKVLGLDRGRAYFGFEPQIACCNDVEQFIRLNHLTNVVVLPVALSDSNGTVDFFSQGRHDEMASLKGDGFDAGSGFVAHVQARIGDQILHELGVGQICAIKIDVEGAELQVLRGLTETLAAQHPSIVFEVLPNFYGLGVRVMHPPKVCAKNELSAEALYGLLESGGYTIFQIDEQGSETEISRFELNEPDRYVGSNYVAHHRTS